MKRLPKPLHYSLLLIILGIIVGTLLSFVNKLTAPVIKENKVKIVEPLLREIVLTAKSFDIATEDYQDLEKNIQDVYIAYSDEAKKEQSAVIVYVVTSNQYGDIEAIIAIDIKTNTFLDIKFVASGQTKGYGDIDTLNKHDFKLKGQPLDGDIDGISKASYTTNSIREAVEIAVNFYNSKFKSADPVDELLEEIKVIIPDAKSYQSIKNDVAVDNNQIVDILAVYNDQGELLSVIYHGTAIGFEDGSVETLVAINLENDQFIGIRIFKARGQSRGYGDKNTLNDFYKNFGNVSIDESVDTISGAIFSSSAVKEVVDLVSTHYKAHGSEIKGLEG